MSQQEFTDAVARVPALWGRKIVTVLEVSDGMARIRVPVRGGFWVPVEKLERCWSRSDERCPATLAP